MKIAVLFLLIGISCLILLNYALKLKFYNAGVDLNFHDSYYVVSYNFVVIFSLLLLATFFTLGGLISYGLNNRNLLIIFFILILADSYFITSSADSLKQLDNKVKEFEKNGWKKTEK